MTKKLLIWSLATVFLATVSLVNAQQPKKMPRIGVIDPTNSSTAVHRTNALQQGLRQFGYVDGTNISIEYRYSEGKSDRLSALATELVDLKVDIVLAANNTVARAVAAITKTVPIIILSGSDPVVAGLVASLARPGGNITGLTNLTLDLGGKRLELIKEIVPKLTRAAVLPSPGGDGRSLREIQAAATALRLQLHIMEMRVADDLERAFTRAVRARAGAFIVTSDPTGIFLTNEKKIIELAAKNRLPGIYPSSRYVNAGGLVSYAANELENYRRAATYVDKILKGTKPADLPIEQPMRFEFIINLKAAKQIGLTIPPNVLVRADKVIR
jgi:putative ABC transport system substrate-binding protein